MIATAALILAWLAITMAALSWWWAILLDRYAIRLFRLFRRLRWREQCARRAFDNVRVAMEVPRDVVDELISLRKRIKRLETTTRLVSAGNRETAKAVASLRYRLLGEPPSAGPLATWQDADN